MFQWLATFTILPSTVSVSYINDIRLSTIFATVRCLPPGSADLVFPPGSPFTVEGARNVFLETVKRGDYDTFEGPVDLDKKGGHVTVILRLYEAFGGHAQVKITISPYLHVIKAYTTNLMEDEDEGLYIIRDSHTTEARCTLSLSFRGFEVKTVKLVLGALSSGQPEKRLSVHHNFSSSNVSV